MEPSALREFGRRYAEAWCSQRPERVASFFAAEGTLQVNDGLPAIGRAAIAEVARGFMTAFPDMVVTIDELLERREGVEFHWTLSGTNSGPGGTGRRVRISGRELWTLDHEGRIARSLGSFDRAAYARQLEHGVER